MARRTSKTISIAETKSQSQVIATQVAENYPKYATDYSFDVFKFVESLPDVELAVKPLEDNISGYIEKKDDRFIIAINSKQNQLRQRFTLAHELGHYYIHKHSLNGIHTDITLFRDANEDRLGIEFAANDFAAELLMSEDSFKKAISKGINTPKHLSVLFEVTEKAILYRAYKLGIVKTFPF